MTKVFVDTNIIIDYLKGHNQQLKQLLENQRLGALELFINPVVIAELYTDINLNTKTKTDRLAELISLFHLVDITKKTGLLAGELLRNAKTDFLGDALIAATCLSENLSLATGNHNHFSKIPELKFYKAV